jgi:predicted flap endonuclease-1-like 5' DNA nuclease
MPAAPGKRRGKGLEYIEGVGGAYSQKLYDAGITTVEELLERGCTPRGRKAIAEATGISDKLILRWVNMADLYRIKGIGQEYAELLEAAGVDTVPELAQRVPANLLAKMEAANKQRKMVRRLPVLSQVESWVEQAKSLPRVVTY